MTSGDRPVTCAPQVTAIALKVGKDHGAYLCVTLPLPRGHVDVIWPRLRPRKCRDQVSGRGGSREPGTSAIFLTTILSLGQVVGVSDPGWGPPPSDVPRYDAPGKPAAPGEPEVPAPGELGIKEKRSWRTWQLMIFSLVVLLIGIYLGNHFADPGPAASQTQGTEPPPASSTTTTIGASSSTTSTTGGTSSTSTTVATSPSTTVVLLPQVVSARVLSEPSLHRVKGRCGSWLGVSVQLRRAGDTVRALVSQCGLLVDGRRKRNDSRRAGCEFGQGGRSRAAHRHEPEHLRMGGEGNRGWNTGRLNRGCREWLSASRCGGRPSRFHRGSRRRGRRLGQPSSIPVPVPAGQSSCSGAWCCAPRRL